MGSIYTFVYYYYHYTIIVVLQLYLTISVELSNTLSKASTTKRTCFSIVQFTSGSSQRLPHNSRDLITARFT